MMLILDFHAIYIIKLHQNIIFFYLRNLKPLNRFVDQFSRSLYVEYKRQGIDVQCQVII